ncbi:MAG: hisH [Ilumatobacteraceae bacterium]|nr:hisH [Ilumatobacteraceae bacterium]
MTAPLIAVLDYGIGNLRSAQKALEKVGADARLTDDHGLIADAAGVVLPGVGNFGRCIEALDAAGLRAVAVAAAEDAAAGTGRPFLGVCVGMQMLFDGSDESPEVPGLAVLPGRVRLLPDTVKRPQMQWNVLDWVGADGAATHMADGQPDPCWMYFVHSYWADAAAGDIAATCEYGVSAVAAVQRGQLWATQFHPEKSAANGLHLLESFVRACA